MDAIQEHQAAFSFRNARRFAIRVCWNMGSFERWSWQLSRNLFGPDDCANSLLIDIHDRMPVILEADNYELWLDLGFTDLECITEMLRPFNPKLMKRYPVSSRVNTPTNDDSECSAEVVVEGDQKARAVALDTSKGLDGANASLRIAKSVSGSQLFTTGTRRIFEPTHDAFAEMVFVVSRAFSDGSMTVTSFPEHAA